MSYGPTIKLDHARMIRVVSPVIWAAISFLNASTLAIIGQSFSEIEARLARRTAE
jgi:hypothetical protein